MRWVLGTALGWLIGFGFVLGLAVGVEAFAGEVQVVVGVGMGAGVGLVQGRLLRAWLGTQVQWLGASIGGMAAPFLLQDLVRTFGFALPTSLWVYVPVGGVLVAIMQARLLRKTSTSARRWIVPCALGWSIPVALIAIGDEVNALGAVGSFFSLSGMFLGGAVLGGVTARPMQSLLSRPAT